MRDLPLSISPMVQLRLIPLERTRHRALRLPQLPSGSPGSQAGLNMNGRMPPGFYLIIAAQFASALADNALLIVTIALLYEQGLPLWWAPLLKFVFTISYVVLAPFVGPLADAIPKARLMAWMNGEDAGRGGLVARRESLAGLHHCRPGCRRLRAGQIRSDHRDGRGTTAGARQWLARGVQSNR